MSSPNCQLHPTMSSPGGGQGPAGGAADEAGKGAQALTGARIQAPSPLAIERPPTGVTPADLRISSGEAVCWTRGGRHRSAAAPSTAKCRSIPLESRPARSGERVPPPREPAQAAASGPEWPGRIRLQRQARIQFCLSCDALWSVRRLCAHRSRDTISALHSGVAQLAERRTVNP